MTTRAIAFVKRDLSIELSYRFAFVLSVLGVFFTVASFYFVSRLIGPAAAPALAPYGGDYFAFVLIGIAFLGFQGTGLESFAGTISGAQAQGTLEAMLVTPTRLSSIILLSSVWSFLFEAVTVLIYLIFGVAVFGADLGEANIPAALVVLILTIVVFSGLGIMSSSVIMVLKRGDPINWLFGTASAFLGGTFFPVTMFPMWLQNVAHALPIFYTLRAMRMAVLTGATIPDIAGDLLALVAFAAVILPLSVLAFGRAVRVAKADGSLGAY